MGWKFWQQNAKGNASKIKLPKPKGIHRMVGMNLVTQQKMDPDYVWTLKSVLRSTAQGKTTFDFRVFCSNSAQSAGVEVANYESLDAHPELIMFHGRFDERSNQIDIHTGG